MQIRNKNKKGFTLTEIIASLVILGVILLIAVPSVGKLQKKFRDEYYKQLNETVITAAKTYFKDNPQERPNLTEKVGARAITSTKLIEDKYLDKIDSYNNDICKSYTVILKNGNDYSYQNCMKCKDNYGEFDNTKPEEDSDENTTNYCDFFPINFNDLPNDIQTAKVAYSLEADNHYFYANNNKSDEDIKRELAIEETAYIENTSVKINDGITVYPKNVTALTLREKYEYRLGVYNSIKVRYSDEVDRNVLIYKYPAPKVSPVNGNKLDSINITLKPLQTTFDGESYPKNNKLGPSTADQFSKYMYSTDSGQTWRDLQGCENMNCDAIKLPVEEGSVRFKIVTNNNNDSFETQDYQVAGKYSVTLDPNGGYVSPTSIAVQKGGTYGQLPTATRDGYTFIGWFDEDYKDNALNYYADKYSDLKNAFGYDQQTLYNHYLTYGKNEGRQISQFIPTTVVTKDSEHTLYAGWLPNKYTVTFNSSCGTVSPSSKQVLVGSKYGDLPTPRKSYYTFVGWFSSDDEDAEQITKDSYVEISGNHTLYARCRKNTVTIKYNANSGTLSSERFSQDSNAFITKNGSRDLMTYDYDKTEINLYNYNSSSASYINIKRTGYYVEDGSEWKNINGDKIFDHNGRYNASQFCDASSEDCSLVIYVNWKPININRRYHANGGTFSSLASGYGTSGEYLTKNGSINIALVSYSASNLAKTFTVANPSGSNIKKLEKTGKSLISGEEWIDAEGNTYAKSSTQTYQTLFDRLCTNVRESECNATLYANWEGATYKVTYNANGGSGGPSSQTKAHGTNLKLSTSKPTRSGWTFLGWSTDKSSHSSQYSAGATYKKNANITLYAIWKKTVTATFNYNKATWNGSTVTKSCNMYNSDTDCDFDAPIINNLSNEYNRRGDSRIKDISDKGNQPYSGMLKVKGWATSTTATSGFIKSGGSVTISSNKTYYAIVDFVAVGTKTYKIIPNYQFGVYSRKNVSGTPPISAYPSSSGSFTTAFQGLIDDANTQITSISDWLYTTKTGLCETGSCHLWIRATVSNSNCKNDTSGHFSSPTCSNGWIPMDWVRWF